jgi:hypothetical protein
MERLAAEKESRGCATGLTAYGGIFTLNSFDVN